MPGTTSIAGSRHSPPGERRPGRTLCVELRSIEPPGVMTMSSSESRESWFIFAPKPRTVEDVHAPMMTVGVRTSVKVDPPDVTVKTSAVKRAARTAPA